MDKNDWVIVASIASDRSKAYRDNEGSAFARAIERAESIVPLSRISAVVLDEHRPWWAPLLADLPPQNVVVEPFDRGTGAGILLAIVRVLRLDPEARIAIIAADGTSSVDTAAYLRARTACAMRDDCVAIDRHGRVCPPISTDVEMIVGSVEQMVGLFQSTQPKLLQTYLTELRGSALFSDEALFAVYPFLPEVAFAADVLEPPVREALSSAAS